MAAASSTPCSGAPASTPSPTAFLSTPNSCVRIHCARRQIDSPVGVFSRDHSKYFPPACDLWQADRVPRSPLESRVPFARWFATDTEANYYAKGNRAFSVESVGYEFNSVGYRSDEFERAPGGALVVFVGDSNTLGVGTPWDRVWTSIVTGHLEERWGVPVRQCNLAWNGTGADYAAMIVHQTVDTLRPDAVFVLWSYLDRLTWFPEPHRQTHFMANFVANVSAQDTTAHAAYLRLATESHMFFNYVRNCQLVAARLSAAGIPYYWGNQDRLPDELLRRYVPLEGYVGKWARAESDLARDGWHAGASTQAAFAASMLDALERDDLRLGHRPAGRPSLPLPPPTRPGKAGSRKAPKVAAIVPDRLQAAARELGFRRRVRSMKRKDPFIY